MRRLFPALLVLVIAAQAARASTHFAVTRIYNRTKHTVVFRYRWGTGGWHRGAVRAGREAVLAWPFRKPDQDANPPLILAYAWDRKNPRAAPKVVHLQASACESRQGSCGKRYDFKKGDASGRYVDLVEL